MRSSGWVWIVVVAVGCSKGEPAALEIAVAEAAGCSTAGWEQVAFTASARQEGVLEIEVVDRMAPGEPVTRLMGPEETRYLLATVGKEEVQAGQPLRFEWSFGSERPGDAPHPDACPDLREAHRDLVDDWAGGRMCTREVARAGRGGGSSSLFEPSCFSGRGWRPRRLVRPGGASGAAGEWHWLAAWVWAPPDAEVALRPDGDAWSFSVGGRPSTPGDGPYPAWTLRARLVPR